MKLTKQKPKFPGDLIQRHAAMVKKGKVTEKGGIATERAELKLMKAGAKKMAKKSGKK